MSKAFHERDFVRVLSLLGSKVWVYFLAALAFAFALGFSFNMVLAFILMDVLNAAVNGQQALLVRSVALAATTFLTGVPLLIGARYVLALFEKKAITGARVRAFRQVVALPIKRFEKEHSGDLLSRCTNDLNTLGKVYTQLIPNLLFGFVLGMIGIVSIFVLSWQIGVFALILGLMTTLASTAIARTLRERSTAMQETLSVLTQRMSDALQSLPVTKMFHLEAINHRQFSQANQQVADAAIAHAHSQGIYEAIDTFIHWMRVLGTLILGLYLLREGYVGLGAIAAAIHLQSNASFLFSNLGGFVTGIQRSLAGSSRVFELLSWETEPPFPVQPQNLDPTVSPLQTMVALQDVSFKHSSNNENPGAGRPVAVLNHVHLAVTEGQVVGLVGPSGSGKSTLIKILLGLYPVEEGKVAVGGRPLGSYSLEELRSLIAYVPQDAYLFDGTIEENIRYGRLETQTYEVVEAAKAAQAHSFISELPKGYQTLVGERGAKLSGGQRQRIAIARALLKNAPILLLDEATSALDSESEALVQQALNILMRGRTTIAVAHRLSTIRNADRIYVLESGRVVEQGTHSELMARSGLYARLLGLQETLVGQLELEE